VGKQKGRRKKMTTVVVVTIIAVLILLGYVGQKREQEREQERRGTFTDTRDGKTYRTIKIGNQVWMAENLAYDTPDSKFYDNDSANGQKYGRLYDWETAKKACPSGWHLPSNVEWQKLVNFAGGDNPAGKKLRAIIEWRPGNYDGTDEFGFSALPGGSGSPWCFQGDVGRLGYWWSATEYDSSDAYSRGMYYGSEYTDFIRYPKNYLLSVRYLQDYTPPIV
jgi:uncharacterized protein (TIGR02145 family)